MSVLNECRQRILIMNLHIEIQQTGKKIDKITKKLSDMREYYEVVAKPQLIRHIDMVFQTGGYDEWPENRRANKTLIATGRLLRSYTRTNADNVSRITKQSFEHGSRLSYASAHEYGLGGRKKRQVIGAVVKRQLLSKSYMRSLNKWLIGGG